MLHAAVGSSLIRLITSLIYGNSQLSFVTFSTLSLRPELLSVLNTIGYQEMTEIQAHSLPEILTGGDIIAQAKTGSGKTLAFALGILQKLDVTRFRVQSLVLCPTRELADQVAKNIRMLARGIHNVKVLTLCGGAPIGPQIGSLQHGAHIIVGTPGRVQDHLRKSTLKLNDVSTLVLDEADRMLDMGFQAAMEAIVEHMPEQRQTLLFSATYPNSIKLIAKRIMHCPVMIAVSSGQNNLITQYFYQLDEFTERSTAVCLLLNQYRATSALVFCNTKRETKDLASLLGKHGFSALALHGDLEQKQREQTLVRFANKSINVLIATDVAARGLDIDEVDLVINYHIARDPEVHTHRIGRTGRSGNDGVACTLYHRNEQFKLDKLEEYQRCKCPTLPLPEQALLQATPVKAAMMTMQIDGGKKHKLRPGDILGALTAQNGVRADQVGKIDVFDYCTYVAVKHSALAVALKTLTRGKLKGRSFRVRKL